MPDLVDLTVKLDEHVNSDMLRTLLLVMLNHLGMKDLRVEFRGADASKIQDLVKNAKAESLQTINVQVLSEIDAKESKESIANRDYAVKADSTISGEGLKKLIDSDDIIVVENGEAQQPTRKRNISFSTFSRLESKVINLQAQIEALNSQILPTDDALLQATRSKQDAKPISDLVQTFNITKRMSGAEEGLDKLASLLETVAKEYADLRKIIEQMQGELGENVADTMKQIKMAANYAKQIRPREDLLNQYRLKKKDKETSTSAQLMEGQADEGYGTSNRMIDMMATDQPKAADQAMESLTKVAGPGTELLGPSANALEASSQIQSARSINKLQPGEASSKVLAESSIAGSKIQPGSVLSVIPKLKPEDRVDADRMNKLLVQHEYMRKNMEYLTAQINTLADFADHILPEILAGMPHAAELRRRINELQTEPDVATDPILPDDSDDMIEPPADLNERLNILEGKVFKHQAKIKKQDMVIAEKTLTIDDRIGKLTKSLADVLDVLGLRKHKRKPKGEEEMDQFMDKISNLEEALIEIGCATQNIIDEQAHKMKLFENISDEIKRVKQVKIDRFELEDILSTKADCDELNKKVTLDKFDEVTNDLARGIDDAITKVAAQESTLAASLLELQESVATKLDKSEINQLKDDIKAQLTALEAELDKLAAMKEGRAAAGAKKKFLTDVNCLSCDRNVAMMTNTPVPCIPALADLPHMRSIRPFITYELDYLRKMKIKDPDVAKYIECEELMRRYEIKSTDSYANLAGVSSLKNRYCGGAHTVTGPHQKVPHTGHFDWNSKTKGQPDENK
ncbi:unnamed protein product [Nesidiocoris tenuis]|uniref:DUF4795 domain-containing protein n=1 Tax=Nesidiocoris tenuis TaxID=355587 RepID=A0A6H5HLN4_9HEMI|nr:unnamed protein product [Nesidiocoris tenuis]